MGYRRDIEPDDFDSTSDDSKDEDWRDPADTGKGSASSSNRGNRERETHGGEDAAADADPDVEMELREPKYPLISLILAHTPAADTEPTTNATSTTSSRRTRRSNPRLPLHCLVSPREIKPQHLRPDYTYLASVRIVVEANLRELFGTEFSDDAEAPGSEVRAGEVGMFWEDEDEILGVPAWSSKPGAPPTFWSYLSGCSSKTDFYSILCIPRSVLTYNSGILATDTSSPTFDLADILSRFQNLEVARLGSPCGYWSGWIERQQSIDGNVDASSSGDTRARKPRIVVQRDQLEKLLKGTITTDGEGKGKKSTTVPVLGSGLGDWEISLEGEACEGWDWAGVARIWR